MLEVGKRNSKKTEGYSGQRGRKGKKYGGKEKKRIVIKSLFKARGKGLSKRTSRKLKKNRK